jgi:G3E family GTPase
MSLPKLFLIAGFLGSGKTTAIMRLAQWARTEAKLRAALITNDQAPGSVDSTICRGGGFETLEIAGGCLCCKSSELVENLERLSVTSQVDIVVAEPVGSCTDLVATVLLPLARIYKLQFQLAPLTVLIDPLRAERMLVLPDGESSEQYVRPQVAYIYRKQLEEAEVIVVNKCDILSLTRRDRIHALLQERFPGAALFFVSARTGEGLSNLWQFLLERNSTATTSLDIDYDLYAIGEADLGWLNGTYSLSFDQVVDAEETLRLLATDLAVRFRQADIDIPHMKAALVCDTTGASGNRASMQPNSQMTVAQWVRHDAEVETTTSTTTGFLRGVLTLNVRACTSPEVISTHVAAALAKFCASAQATLVEITTAAFRPSKPEPLYRMAHPLPLGDNTARDSAST